MAKKPTADADTQGPVVSLLDQLATPVAAPITPVFDNDPGDDSNNYVDAVIDETEAPPTQQWQQSFKVVTGDESYEQQTFDGDEPVSLSPDDIAVIGVNMLDGFQQFGLAMLSKVMKLTGEERELLPNLDTSGKIAYPDGSKEAIAMQKYKKHLELVKKLPFDEGEKQRLTDAGKIYARTLNVQVSPLQGLLMAMSEVTFKRASMVIMDNLS